MFCWTSHRSRFSPRCPPTPDPYPQEDGRRELRLAMMIQSEIIAVQRHSNELPLLGPDRRVLQAVIVIGLAQHAIGCSVRHEFGGERQRQRVIERYSHRGHGLL